MKNTCCLYWTKVEALPSPEVWKYYLDQLPEALAQRLSKYPTLQDRYQSLCGKLLLQQGFNQWRNTDDTNYLRKLQYSPKGRPYLPDGPATDFNISHSGSIVVCAITGSGHLGVDVQQVIRVDPRLAQLFLSKKEWKGISKTATDEQLIKMWAKKEAITKTTGDGLSLSFGNICLDQDRYSFDGKYIIRTQEVLLSPGYACFVASDRNIRTITTKYVPITELLLSMSMYH